MGAALDSSGRAASGDMARPRLAMSKPLNMTANNWAPSPAVMTPQPQDAASEAFIGGFFVLTRDGAGALWLCYRSATSASGRLWARASGATRLVVRQTRLDHRRTRCAGAGRDGGVGAARGLMAKSSLPAPPTAPS